MFSDNDTIVAVATPPGRGGVGIVRVSGPNIKPFAEAVLGKTIPPRRADYLPFMDEQGSVIDEGIAIYFAAPNSFTGEDVIEFQGHGGPVVLDMLIEHLIHRGARLARPGEFSERAFLNGKLDLAQAEAIADLIDAGSREAARGALHSLQGHFSIRVHALTDELIALRMYVESAIDFPEEEIDFLAESDIGERLDALTGSLQQVRDEAKQGRLLREGMTVVLAGQPNAGKSSLLNALAGAETAIVTEIPGTTRDLLREQIVIDGMPVHVIDTAGLRESNDAVEQEGIRRAWDAIEKADRLLLIVDDKSGFTDEDRAIIERLPESLARTIIFNKIDLSQQSPRQFTDPHGPAICLSAKQGDGIDLLREHLKSEVGYQGGGEGRFMARRRHLDALARAAERLDVAQIRFNEGSGELLAEELKLAQQDLSEITGEFSADDLLGKIFAEFCIGK